MSEHHSGTARKHEKIVDVHAVHATCTDLLIELAKPFVGGCVEIGSLLAPGTLARPWPQATTKAFAARHFRVSHNGTSVTPRNPIFGPFSPFIEALSKTELQVQLV